MSSVTSKMDTKFIKKKESNLIITRSLLYELGFIYAYFFVFVLQLMRNSVNSSESSLKFQDTRNQCQICSMEGE